MEKIEAKTGWLEKEEEERGEDRCVEGWQLADVGR